MGIIVLRTFIIILSLWLGVAQASSPELVKLDRLMAQQLQVERSTAALQLEAQQSLADNQQLLALYRQEKKALTDALNRQQQQQDEVAEQRNDLLDAQTKQEQRMATYEQQLAQGMQLLNTLWSQLPPPLVVDLQGQWLQLQNAKQGLSKRFGLLITLLSSLEEFNSSINLHRGILTHHGEQWRTEQLFIGLAQGYYKLPDGSGVGIGYVVNGVWQWHSAPDHQTQINRAFAIYQGQHPVEFVTLPLAVIAGEQP